jgi:hypothetical protein
VRVMNIKDDDRVSAVALVVESSADVADVEADGDGAGGPTGEAGDGAAATGDGKADGSRKPAAKRSTKRKR